MTTQLTLDPEALPEDHPEFNAFVIRAEGEDPDNDSFLGDSIYFPDFPDETLNRLQQFRICDPASAGWYLDKLAGLDEQEARYKAQFAALMDRVQAGRERITGRFASEFEAWAREELERENAGKKKPGKTLRLFEGSVVFTARAAGVAVSDPKAALEYAEEHLAGCVVRVPRLDTAAYKATAARLLENGGELLPGCEWQAAGDRMSIRFPKAGTVGKGGGDEE